MASILLKNCSEVVYSKDGKEKVGEALGVVEVLHDVDVLIVDGKFKQVGKDLDVPFEGVEILDCAGKAVIPGFVDGHTHPVFDGDRANEFSMKLAGASYMEIHEKGGGIHYTVDQTRNCPEEKLTELCLRRLDQMLSHGTIVAEAKSGYGLDCETEMKMLRVIKKAKETHPVKIQSTYLCAHAVPPGRDPAEMTKEIVEEHIPTVAKAGLGVDNIDVFCEKGVYDAEQSRKMLEAGMERGWHVNFHAEELNYIQGGEMGCELNARAMSHLELLSSSAIKSMSQKRIAGVILPTTAYILKLIPPPVREMIRENVIVALGSDFNPNAPCFSMPLVMHLACIICKMNMEEAFNAATINAAYSLGLTDSYGSITEGKVGSCLVLDAPSWKHIVYQLGNHQNLMKNIIINGRIHS
ncbi:Oidioi.mRNA.OKI2018_I69.chr1.g3798.t1.cds [Oikopleura dioica]|uniref:Probable imidazolonepropionase n=1 Tax=Oikopleura dioica TaxID=34765 RepID=A0ABN7SVB8_OIKDI|nr:Oidioi.mRNA.OKI2018_I69.chr1.g3798.t1.cds [Oikopleura dioica]